MIELLNGAAAFLKRDGHYLLMKRGTHKTLAPGVWSGIGGRMEPHEINDPLTACLREIQEETSITPEHIFNIALKYIIIRRAGNVVRQSYLYFGETDAMDVVANDEGELFWIPEHELLNRKFTQTFEAMLRHYIEASAKESGMELAAQNVTVGVAENDNGKLKMQWVNIEDFES